MDIMQDNTSLTSCDALKVWEAFSEEEKEKICRVADEIGKIVNRIMDALIPIIEQIAEMIRPVIERAMQLCRDLSHEIIMAYPNKRVVHLALHAKKARTRKKNLHRIWKDSIERGREI